MNITKILHSWSRENLKILNSSLPKASEREVSSSFPSVIESMAPRSWPLTRFLTFDATNYYESVAIEYCQLRGLLSLCTWNVSESGHLGFFFQRELIGKRVQYCAFHTAQFNIVTRCTWRCPHLCPRNDTSNTPKTSYCQTTVGPNDKTSSNIYRLPIKFEPWLAYCSCRSITAHTDELRLIFRDAALIIPRNFEIWLEDSEIELLGYSVYRHR